MAIDRNAGLPQQLLFPPERTSHWEDNLPEQLGQFQPGAVEIFTQQWQLTCRDLQRLQTQLQEAGFSIALVRAGNPQTVISAQALGLQVKPIGSQQSSNPEETTNEGIDQLRVHRGTLRSGDQLDTAGDLLILGDVNPGARVSAGGDVMIWGRLRGIAHAGQFGDKSARVVALQLRPLQLRIADQVARGPEDQPQAGLAEEARIERGEIVIEPADPRLSRRFLEGDPPAAPGRPLA